MPTFARARAARVLSFAAAALVALAAEGCGGIAWRADDVAMPKRWPLVSPPGPRPTLVVRTTFATKDARELMKEKLRAPSESGLFASVAYDAPTDVPEKIQMFRRLGIAWDSAARSCEPLATDFALGLEIDVDNDLAWYAAPGVITLGALPLPFPGHLHVRAGIFDATGERVGYYFRYDRWREVLWTPLLPFNLLAGLSNSGGVFAKWDDTKHEMIETMVASILEEAQKDGVFRPRAPEKTTDKIAKKPRSAREEREEEEHDDD